MALTRLIYFSENQIDPAGGSVVRRLSEILSASNRNNKRLGLTGALVFDDMWFLQCIEGERAAAWAQFERIKEDERHGGVVLVELRDVTSRLFGNWWMGLAKRDASTEKHFEPFSRNGVLRPNDMAADQILNLMVSLSATGLSRTLAPEAA